MNTSFKLKKRVLFNDEHVIRSESSLTFEFINQFTGTQSGQRDFERDHTHTFKSTLVVQVQQPSEQMACLHVHVYLLIEREPFVQLDVHVFDARFELERIDLAEYVQRVQIAIAEHLDHVPQVNQMH